MGKCPRVDRLGKNSTKTHQNRKFKLYQFLTHFYSKIQLSINFLQLSTTFGVRSVFTPRPNDSAQKMAIL